MATDYGDNTHLCQAVMIVPMSSGSPTRTTDTAVPDADLDGWADVDDAFPYDTLQWVDTDGDGWGDNYAWFNDTIADLDNPGEFIQIRNQSGDAFPTVPDQWSDMDGDGWGDNQTSFFQPDAFPLRHQSTK